MSTADTPDFTRHPVDPAAAAALEAGGLRLGLVDTADQGAFDSWIRAESRGFLDALPTEESLARTRGSVGYRRTTGVWDVTIPAPDEPVGTLNSWLGELSVPGDRVIPSWAISGVSVASTHRRRGIARSLLEGELRTAAALGAPLAMLTVSEATIYGRFGFSPAALSADWTIETRRAQLTGRRSGRVDFLERDAFREAVVPLHERVRITRPGEIQAWPGLWDRVTGIGDEDQAAARKKRFVRYTSDDGQETGLAAFHIEEQGDDFSAHRLVADLVVTETDDAYAGLLRFLLEMDLVSTVELPLRSVDEPLRWMVGDFRAVRSKVRDHQWLRLLDVPAAFAGRSYATAGRLGLVVEDALGFTAGTWLLETDGGAGSARRIGDDELVDGLPILDLAAAELSSLYLGGVSAVTLLRAGRLAERRPGDAARADTLLRSAATPWLGLWY